MSVNKIDPEKLGTIAVEAFGPHPFEDLPLDRIRQALPEYAVMSERFPYIQAAAIGRLGEVGSRDRATVPQHVRARVVVGSFLVFDEFGGYFKTVTGGRAALPTILRTEDFHARLLEADVAALFRDDARRDPGSAAATASYLQRLSYGLSSLDPVDGTAMMVSFEVHANHMISALWNSIAKWTERPKEELTYFQAHVGGDDPAEKYHVTMTAKMIELLVDDGDAGRFVHRYLECYDLHRTWCAAIAAGVDS